MEKTLLDRTRRARIACGTAAVVMGAVALGVNWPYLVGSREGDPVAAWLSAVGAVIGLAVGSWILAGPRSKGERLVLSSSRGRLRYGAVITVVCVGLFIAGLLLEQPTTSTGLPALLMANAFLTLFVRDGQENR